MSKSPGYVSPSDYGTCPRCGYTRQVKSGARDKLCVDCKAVDPDWPNVGPPSSEDAAVEPVAPVRLGPRPVPRFYPAEGDRVAGDIKRLLARLDMLTRARTRTCGDCGCLLASWERECVACQVTRREQGGAA